MLLTYTQFKNQFLQFDKTLKNVQFSKKNIWIQARERR